MKTTGKAILYIVLSLLALMVLDSWVFHPAGRYQMSSQPGLLRKIDTTTGRIWRYNFETDNWEVLPDAPRK